MSSRPYVFITRKLPEETLLALNETAEVKMWPQEEEPVPREVLLEEAGKADGLLTMLSDRIDKELLENAPKLKVVANMAVGFDNIDVPFAGERNVTVCNTPDVLTETTADLTFALLMASARRLAEASEYVKEGRWKNWSPLFFAGADIHHKTIGIFGMGRIGAAVAKRAAGFGMKIIYHNRSRNTEAENEFGASLVSFTELLEHSDYIVSLAPLTEATKNVFNEDAFKRMKNTAFFINASRGGLVDEAALERALAEKQLAGAGLDVFKEEPIGKDHPLLQFKNVIALPHIGSASRETRLKMASLAARNIANVLNGKKPETEVKE